MSNLNLHTGGSSRRYLDAYPTPPECTVALMEFLHLAKWKTILEPACGDGMMSVVLEKYVEKGNVMSCDISENCYGHGGVDYLREPFCDFDAIITNPPFSLSLEFIEKALKEADIVAMLLKSQYWHSKSRYEFFFKHKPAYVLPLTWRPNFAPDKGSSPTMEVAWTVWETWNNTTKYIPLEKPKAGIF